MDGEAVAQYENTSENESRSVMSDSLWPQGLYSPWNSPGQNTGMGSLSLLQGIFPTQVSNPSLPYCRRILYQLSHNWSPRILEWVAFLFSSGSSQQNEKETYWMGKKILANHIIWKGANIQNIQKLKQLSSKRTNNFN